MPQSREYARRDVTALRRRCEECGERLGFGRTHRPGCRVVCPDAPPGEYYSPADVAELCGVDRQAFTPILNRWRAGKQRPEDPLIMMLGDRLALERESIITWLAEHKPRWHLKMKQLEIRSKLCVACGESMVHRPDCWLLIPVTDRKKTEGFCGTCGAKMTKACDYRERTCRRCKTVRSKKHRERPRAPR